MYRIDEPEIRRALELILQPEQVTELRCLNCQVDGEWRAGTYSGYFSRESIDELIDALRRVQSATACYFVPNPIKPELLARSFNRARIVKDREPITADKDILERRWLLIDVDTTRPTGISSTESEKAAARRLITDIDAHLWEQDHRLPAGIFGDSGNGSHLMIPIRQPVASDFCERLLKHLARTFNTDKVTVDESVYNPSRIWKLPGTLVCKGDNSPGIGRIWRMARITQVCEALHV